MNAPLLTDLTTLRAANLHDAEECARIEGFVLSQDGGTPFHLPKWLCAIERATGQEAHCLLAENGALELVGILPYHIVHSALFGRALVSSAFAVGGGISATSQKVAERLAAAVWGVAERHSCPTMELRGGMLPTNNNWIIKTEAHANFMRPLMADDEAELLAVPRKQRAEVRKGLEKELTVEAGNGERDLDWHYAIYSESVRNLGTPVFPRALMREVAVAFGDDVDVLTVLKDGRPVASVMSLYHKGVVMPYWGGGIWEARALRANDVMYYALMNHARRRGCTAFDFGRSKTGSGAYAFKKNWGLEPEALSYALRTADGAEPRDVNPNSPKYRAQIAVWQRLPLGIANRLGPWIAKGLG
jgi:FemAB-related protein (PEP-CTERM system-associated)